MKMKVDKNENKNIDIYCKNINLSTTGTGPVFSSVLNKYGWVLRSVQSQSNMKLLLKIAWKTYWADIHIRLQGVFIKNI